MVLNGQDQRIISSDKCEISYSLKHFLLKDHNNIPANTIFNLRLNKHNNVFCVSNNMYGQAYAMLKLLIQYTVEP